MNRHGVPLLAMAALLAACAGNPAIPFDRAANPAVQTIGVLTPYAPPTGHVPVAGAGEGGPGLIVALVAAGVRTARESRVNEAFAARGFNASQTLNDELVAAVAALGYRVVNLPAERASSGLLKTYAGLQGADAWFDCDSAWGYFAAGAGDAYPFRPDMRLRCRLVRAGDGEVLMNDLVWYSSTVTAAGNRFITLSPDPAFAFTTSDILVAEADRAIEGLRAAFRASAQAIAGRLK